MAVKGKSAKKTTVPRKKYPPRIVIIDQWNRAEGSRSIEDAITKAVNQMNKVCNYPPEYVGVYQLVKVVRRQRAPVEIEDMVERKGE